MTIVNLNNQQNALHYSEWVQNVVCQFALDNLNTPSELFLSSRNNQSNLSSSVRAFPTVLKTLIHQKSLSEAEAFLLCLVGSMEESHWLNLAIAELQSPNDQPYVSLHLMCELITQSFGERWSPIEIRHHRLVTEGLIEVEGQGPTPSQTLRMNSEVWRALTSLTQDPKPIPQELKSGPVSDTSFKTLSQSFRLGQLKAIVLRGSKQRALEPANELATWLDKTPSESNWQQWLSTPALQSIAQASNQLPIFHVTLGSSETIQLPEDQIPSVFILNKEGRVIGEGVLELNVSNHSYEERFSAWRKQLPDTLAQTMASQCFATTEEIPTIIDTARTLSQGHPIDGTSLRKARSQRASGKLKQLAHNVEREVTLDALILNEPLSKQMSSLLLRCQHRDKLWEGLGKTAHASQNTGVRVMFSGDSGTGKTLAASYIATQLHAPLYRLDMATVLNKYIGETEKNLGLLLDEAAERDVILLIDEADSLFGKRTDAEHAGDRFANALTNYLLTRIETHSGIVVLTTNSRARIDSAFTRRLDFIIEFTQPGKDERFALWCNHLGERNPGEEFCRHLAAYSDLSGGFIRNAVIHAATEVPMSASQALPKVQLIESLMLEYQKLGIPVPSKLQLLLEACEAATDG